MRLTVERVDLAKAAGATATYYTSGVFNGLVHMVGYSTGTGLAPSTAAITAEGAYSGVDALTSAPLTATKVWFPREVAVESSGASTAITVAAEKFPLVNERIKVSIAGCTSALSAGEAWLDFYVEGA